MNTLDALRRAHESARRSVEDDWFAALDGSVIRVGTAFVTIQVLGIHRDSSGLWIQLAPFHESDRGMVVHCWPDNDPDQVLAALWVRLSAGLSQPDVIDASRTLH